jgi:hypothetical protein
MKKPVAGFSGVQEFAIHTNFEKPERTIWRKA